MLREIRMTGSMDESVALGPRDYTEQLSNWISTVSHKKQKCSRRFKRNFRVEAVLTHTLHKARYELRSKQLRRMARWQRLKKELLKGVYYGSCRLYHAVEAERQTDFVAGEKENMTVNWYEELDLVDLDDFLRKVGEVKTHVER